MVFDVRGLLHHQVYASPENIVISQVSIRQRQTGKREKLDTRIAAGKCNRQHKIGYAYCMRSSQNVRFAFQTHASHGVGETQ